MFHILEKNNGYGTCQKEYRYYHPYICYMYVTNGRTHNKKDKGMNLQFQDIENEGTRLELIQLQVVATREEDHLFKCVKPPIF
jgi:hypothetical protein